MRGTVWQVPEACGWNPFVQELADSLNHVGWTALTPGVCRDECEPVPAATPQWSGPIPDVVHLHWPEKLARTLGREPALALLRSLRDRGARVVQTVHNVVPHEHGHGLAAWLHDVDALCDGVHFFSPAHEHVARSKRPNLPGLTLHLAHPLYSALAVEPAPAALRVDIDAIGCFGRLRDYKRTAEFAEVFLRELDSPARLVIAGHPDSPVVDRQLQRLAGGDARLEYRPEFVAEGSFAAALRSVAWVVLPYARLYSSGVLVAALQSGCRVISPAPVGGVALYGDVAPARWAVIDPWDDRAAVVAWRRLRRETAGTATLALPAWSEAAAHLAAFYARLPVPARTISEG